MGSRRKSFSSRLVQRIILPKVEVYLPPLDGGGLGGGEIAGHGFNPSPSPQPPPTRGGELFKPTDRKMCMGYDTVPDVPNNNFLRNLVFTMQLKVYVSRTIPASIKCPVKRSPPAAKGRNLHHPPDPAPRDSCHFFKTSGRYSKCIRSKCDHLPPQMKPCFSNNSTISWG